MLLAALVLLAAVLSNPNGSSSASYTAATPAPLGSAVPSANRWSVHAGGALTVSAGGFRPGSPVAVTLHAGSYTDFPTAHADRRGHVSIQLAVPHSAPSGWADVVLRGTALGGAVSDEIGVEVLAPAGH